LFNVSTLEKAKGNAVSMHFIYKKTLLNQINTNKNKIEIEKNSKTS